MELVIQRKRPKSTRGLGIYWRFADERHRVYMRRVETGCPVVSDDPVIAYHRFTNVFRAADRVSQYLLTDVIYAEPDLPFRDQFARTILFKMFNKIETWHALESRIGRIDATSVLDGSVREVVHDVAARTKVYSAAYIMPPPRQFDGPKAVRHVELLAEMLRSGLHTKVQRARTLGKVVQLLSTVPSLGPFLAYQYAVDLNYGPVLGHDENQHVTPGPGAIRGLRKCFSDFGEFKPADVIHYVRDRMPDLAEDAGTVVPSLWGRDPHLIDLQNVFCEVDKYTRVADPTLPGSVSGARIKQRYRPDSAPISSWFPPHWGVNDESKRNPYQRPNALERSPAGLDELGQPRQQLQISIPT